MAGLATFTTSPSPSATNPARQQSCPSCAYLSNAFLTIFKFILLGLHISQQTIHIQPFLFGHLFLKYIFNHPKLAKFMTNCIRIASQFCIIWSIERGWKDPVLSWTTFFCQWLPRRQCYVFFVHCSASNSSNLPTVKLSLPLLLLLASSSNICSFINGNNYPKPGSKEFRIHGADSVHEPDQQHLLHVPVWSMPPTGQS